MYALNIRAYTNQIYEFYTVAKLLSPLNATNLSTEHVDGRIKRIN